MPHDSANKQWAVWRVDDNGHSFVVCGHLNRAEAERLAAEFEARGHKQTYWAEPEDTITELPDWHLAEIAKRRAEADATSMEGTPWREALARIRSGL